MVPFNVGQASLLFAQQNDQGGSFGVALIQLAIGIVMLVALWMVFQKAGKPGWAAIIPIYNVIVLLQIAGKPWWWILLFLIPIVNLVVIFLVDLEISKKFGNGAPFAIGLFFLPFIFYCILGFGSARYQG